MEKFKAVQKDHYDKVFGKKHAWSEPNFSGDTGYFVERFLDTIVDPGAKKILEIGCGNGFLTFFLLKKSSQITAVDISEKAVENMRHQFSGEIHEGSLKLKCADAIDFLENSDDNFDVIVGSGIVHHIEKDDWEKLFSLSFKRLKPGGIFACGPEPNAGGLYGFCWRFAKFFYRIFRMDYDWEVEKGTLDMISKDLKFALRKAGFQSPEVAPFQVVPHFHSKILAYIDKKMIKYASGRLSLYVIIKGKKI